MLDPGTAQIAGAVLFLAPVAGAAAIGRSVVGPRGKTVAARDSARGTEALWLGTIGVVQLWTLGVALLPAWFYSAPSLGDFPGSTIVQVLGLVLWIAGGSLGLWAIRTMGRQMTVSIRLLEGHRLVQEGPYSRIRHPTYTGVLLFTLGIGLAFLDVPILLMWVLVVLLARYRAHVEEDFLRSPEAFGEAYASYAARTGRFLPRVRGRGT